jgi:hypothetical protein
VSKHLWLTFFKWNSLTVKLQIPVVPAVNEYKNFCAPENSQELRLKHVRVITNKNIGQKIGIKYHIYIYIYIYIHTHTHTHHNISFVPAMTEIRDVCLYLIEKWAAQIWSREISLNFVWKEERMQVKHVQCRLKHIAPKLLRHIFISTGSKRKHIIALWSWVFLISHTKFSRKCERTNFPCHYQK